MGNPTYGTKERYRYEQRLDGGRVWELMDRFEAVEQAFIRLRRDHQEGPLKLAARDRERRVIDGQRNLPVIWPAHDWRMPKLSSHAVSSHLVDALSYVVSASPFVPMVGVRSREIVV